MRVKGIQLTIIGTLSEVIGWSIARACSAWTKISPESRGSHLMLTLLILVSTQNVDGGYRGRSEFWSDMWHKGLSSCFLYQNQTDCGNVCGEPPSSTSRHRIGISIHPAAILCRAAWRNLRCRGEHAKSSGEVLSRCGALGSLVQE